MVITYLLTQSYEQLLHKVLPSGLHCNEGKRTLTKENVSETTDGIIVFSFLKIGCHGFCFTTFAFNLTYTNFTIIGTWWFKM